MDTKSINVFCNPIIFIMSQAEKNSSLIRLSGGKKCVFLIKTVLNGGIRAISFWKKNVLNRGPWGLKPCYPGDTHVNEEKKLPFEF